MTKKIVMFLIILTVAVMFVIPINADPTDVVLDQQVTLVIPARFTLVDQNNDQQPEAMKAQVQVRSYREGNFEITGKLEAKQNGVWTEVGAITKPFPWSTSNNTAELIFPLGLIREQKVSGPYRVSVGLRDGDWELPLQVVGFTPKTFAQYGQK
jgi:hypothetical protein